MGEKDPDLAVILFESANPDFFFAQWDLTDDSSSLPPGPTGQSGLVDILIRISKLPVITPARSGDGLAGPAQSSRWPPTFASRAVSERG